jgi:hypothetical protein
MSSNPIKNLSSFGQAALALDNEFSELERLGAQIDKLVITSDSGLERSRQLLAKFGECGQRIAEGVQTLAKTLEDARARAEKAAMLVTARAGKVEERHHESERMFERFRVLGESVRKVTGAVASLKKPKGEKLSEDEKTQLPKQLGQFDGQLADLIEQAQALKDDARTANMKSLERNADALGQSLQSARRKLKSISS